MPKLFFLLIIILIRVLLVDSSLAEIIGTTIRVRDELNSTNIIVFEDGKFTLGFFTISECAGMKLDFDSATWQDWHLTSWVSDSYPASEAFALSWQPTTTTTTAATLKGSGRGRIVIYRRGELYRSMVIDDPNRMCWNNCNCGKFRSYKDRTGCVLWTVKSSYQENPCSSIAYLLVQRNSYSYSYRGKKKKWIWIVIVVFVSVVMLILGSLYYLRMKKHRLEEEGGRS
ncbi:unnamed protein product [Camellia sinensis]